MISTNFRLLLDGVGGDDGGCVPGEEAADAAAGDDPAVADRTLDGNLGSLD